MKATTEFRANQAFVLTESHVQVIWNIFSDGGVRASASAACSDGLTREFETCEDLLAYQNPKRALIQSLDISGRRQDTWERSCVSFSKHFSAPIYVSIAGDETFVEKTRAKIADTVDDTRAWYSWLATVDLGYFWVLLMFMISLLLYLTDPHSHDTDRAALDIKTALLVTVAAFAMLGLCALTIWAAVWAKRRFFTHKHVCDRTGQDTKSSCGTNSLGGNYRLHRQHYHFDIHSLCISRSLERR